MANVTAAPALSLICAADAEHVSAIDTLAHEIEGEFTALTRQRTAF